MPSIDVATVQFINRKVHLQRFCIRYATILRWEIFETLKIIAAQTNPAFSPMSFDADHPEMDTTIYYQVTYRPLATFQSDLKLLGTLRKRGLGLRISSRHFELLRFSECAATVGVHNLCNPKVL